MKHDRIGLIILASLTLLMNCGVDVPDGADNSSDGIVRGKAEKKLPQVVAMRFNRFNGGWVLCSGTYFASRVVVTAAHCLQPDAIPGQGFVYFGGRLPDGRRVAAGRFPSRASRRCGRASRPRRRTRITTPTLTIPTSRSCTWTASCRSIRSRCCAMPVTSLRQEGRDRGLGRQQGADRRHLAGRGRRHQAQRQGEDPGHADRGGLPPRRSQPRHPRPRDPRRTC